MRAELTIEIARTPDDVFAYLTDASNLPEWQAGVKSATVRDGPIEESRSLLGRELRTDGGTTLTVTAEGDVPGFAAGLLARRAERQFRKDFERLKQILEG